MNLLRKITLIFSVAVLSFSSSALAAAELTPIYNDKGSMLAQIYSVAGSGGYGEQVGNAAASTFRQPAGLAVSVNNELYISDTANHKILKLSSENISIFAGPSSSFLRDPSGQPQGTLFDGSKENVLFNAPSAIAYSADGALYVADTDNNAIRKISSSGQTVTIAGNGKIGAADGKGAAAAFYHPEGIAVTKSGIVYVADTLNHTIRKILPDGTTSTITAASDRVIESYPGLVLASGDYKDGPLSRALFNEPTGLALDAKGNLFVSDSGNQRIRYIDFSINQVTTVAGSPAAEGLSVYEDNALYAKGNYKNGAAKTAAFNFPKGISLDSGGGLLIADSLNNVIRYLKNGIVTTIAGSQAGESGLQDGLENAALFNHPRDVVIASDGTIYVAETGNNLIRKIAPYRLPAAIIKNPSVIKVVLGDKQIVFDARPEITAGRVMVPVRQIAEALGYTLEFSSNGKTVSLEKDSSTIELFLDSKTIKHTDQNGAGQDGNMDVAPYVKGNRTYVPLRFFAEETGVDVQWITAYQTAVLRYK